MNINQSHNSTMNTNLNSAHSQPHNQTTLSEWSNIVIVPGGYEIHSTDTMPHPPLEFVTTQNDLPLYLFQPERPFFNHNAGEDPAFVQIRRLEEKVGRLEADLASLSAVVFEPKAEMGVDSADHSRRIGNCSNPCCASTSDEKCDSDSGTSPAATLDPVPERKRRRYVRKPKPDPNAPVKPLTGYATFANDIRKTYANDGLCFAEIANRIGKDWQHMSEELREAYMSNAAIEKGRFDAEMARYRKTDQYAAYQRYLAAFKKKEREREEARKKKTEQEARNRGA